MRHDTPIYIAFRRLLPVNHANLSKSATFDPKGTKNAPRRISASGPCKHTCLGKIAPSTYARIISRHVSTSTPLPLRHSPYKTRARRRRAAGPGTVAGHSARAPRFRPDWTRRCRRRPPRVRVTVDPGCRPGTVRLGRYAHSQPLSLPPLTATVTPRNRRSSRLRIRTRLRPPRGYTSATGAARP